MTRLLVALAALGWVSCWEEPVPPDAPDPVDAHVDAPMELDGSAAPDADLDAAPEFRHLLCTGRPVPDGLICVVQDSTVVGSCAGHGAVAFDGSQCRVARGSECNEAGRGAFDSLEECAVTCADAGHCRAWMLRVIPEDGGTNPDGCPDAPAECVNMWLENNPLPAECDAWAPFSPPTPNASASELPYPQQWDVLWSFTLVAEYVGNVYCGQTP